MNFRRFLLTSSWFLFFHEYQQLSIIFKKKILIKCHKTIGEVAKDYVRRLCYRRNEVDKKNEHFKMYTKYT